MTKSEKIQALETELELERAKHNAAKAQLKEYKKREESYVTACLKWADCSSDGYRARIEVYSSPAPYGAANFDYKSFTNALGQFLRKWNSAAQETCGPLK